MCHNPTRVSAAPTKAPKPLNPKAEKFFPPKANSYSPNNGGIKFPHQMCVPKFPAPAAHLMHGYPFPAPALCFYNPYQYYQPSSLETYYGADFVPEPGYGRKMGQNGYKLVPNKMGGLKGGKRGFGNGKMSRRFVPPRSRFSNLKKWQNSTEEQRIRGKVCGLQWRPKKANSDDGLGVVGLGSSSSPPTPPPCHSDDDGTKCKKTSVMIRNIPNQYRCFFYKWFCIFLV